jgi:antitoxin (DNA-binding transcriptional repressor) of toxin-antitoxin stability system
MRAVDLEILKNKLGEYARLAATGETVLITDQDRVVARLGPPAEGRHGDLPDASLADAVRAGLVTPAALPPGPPPEAKPAAVFDDVLAELDRVRADR